MKVADAPPIITRLDQSMIDAAARKAREIYQTAPFENEGGELKRLAPDVWAIDKPLGLHTDRTAPGHYVFGVVLLNDAGLLLQVKDVLYDLPVGTVYSLDGHRRHGALAHNGVNLGRRACA